MSVIKHWDKLKGIWYNSSKEEVYEYEFTEQPQPEIIKHKDISGKVPLELVPMEFEEYTADALRVGREKGYENGSWMKETPRSLWLAAARRHMIAYTKGSRGDGGEYYEYHPITRDFIVAHHIKAAIFNLQRIQWSIEHEKEKEDDRPI